MDIGVPLRELYIEPLALPHQGDDSDCLVEEEPCDESGHP